MTTACAEKTTAVALPVVTTPRFPDFVRPGIPPDLVILPAATNQERAWQFLQAGDIHNADDGLFANDTRMLSKFELLIAGKKRLRIFGVAVRSEAIWRHPWRGR